MIPLPVAQSVDHPFLPLLLVMGIAFLIPTIARRFPRLPVPVVVWEIAFGALIGKSGFNLIVHNSSLEFLSELGFAFLMFLSGLEVDLSLLRSSGKPRAALARNPLVIASCVFAITLLLALVASYGMYALNLVDRPVLMGLILSTTSLGLVVPTLQQSGYMSTPLGQAILASAVLADFVTLFMITIVTGMLVGGLTMDLFLGFGLLIFFAVLLRLGRGLKERWHAFVGENSTNSPINTEVRGSVTLMLCLVAVAEALGTEVILGAFLSGVLLSLLADDRGKELHTKLEALGFGFFIPIFFVMVGVRLNIGDLFGSSSALLLVPLLLAFAFVIKIVAALPFRLIATWKETLAAGFLISSRLSLIIAAAEIGLRLGIISETLYAAVVCVAVITCVVGPSMFQVLLPARRGKMRSVLVVGSGVSGTRLAERLASQNWDVSLMTTTEQSAVGSRLPDTVKVIQSHDTEVLAQLKEAQSLEVVVCATSNDAYNVQVCQKAKSLGIPRTIALLRDMELTAQMFREEIPVINPFSAEVTLLDLAVTNPALFQVLVNRELSKQVAEAGVYNPELSNRAIKTIDWPGDVLVFSIVRNDGALIPDGNTKLRIKDRVVLVGTPPHVDDAVSYLERGRNSR